MLRVMEKSDPVLLRSGTLVGTLSTFIPSPQREDVGLVAASG